MTKLNDVRTTNDPLVEDSIVCASIRSKANLKTKVIHPYVPVKVFGSSRVILINCAIDTCSSDCWVNESLLQKLNIKTN